MNLFLSAYNIFTQLSTLPVHKLLPWSLFLTSLLWKIQSCLCRLRRVHVAEGTTLYSQLLFRIAEVQGQATQEVLGSSTGLQEQHCSCLTGFRRDILPRCSQTTALWFLLQCCSDHFFFFFFFNRTFCHGNHRNEILGNQICETTKLLQVTELHISVNFAAAFKCKAHLFELVFSVHYREQYLHIPTQTFIYKTKEKPLPIRIN